MLDPLHGPRPTPRRRRAQLHSLAYDGLVAYRRVGGAAGHTLVGALATTAPAPSADGKTYVFTLRPGLRYSDGTAGPADGLQGLDGALPGGTATSPASAPALYADIVGARRCMRRRPPCDLSRGIETDVPARTITVHLTRPDGDLLHKLDNALRLRRARRQPARPTAGVTPPGTGPYRLVAWGRGAVGRSCATATSGQPCRSRGRVSRIASKFGCTSGRRSNARSAP